MEVMFSPLYADTHFSVGADKNERGVLFTEPSPDLPEIVPDTEKVIK